MLSINDYKKIDSLSIEKKIELVFSGENLISYTSNKHQFWSWLKHHISRVSDTNKLLTKEEYKQFLILMSKKFPKLFIYKNDIDFLYHLFIYREYFINAPNKLKRKKSSAYKYIITHLFVKYKVPEFLYSSFYSNVKDRFAAIELFIWITNGNSLKKFPLLPNYSHLKKSIYYIYDCPASFTLEEAYRYCQLKSLNNQ